MDMSFNKNETKEQLDTFKNINTYGLINTNRVISKTVSSLSLN